MKRSLLLLIVTILSCQFIMAQDFDSKLEKIAEGIATKINSTDKKKVAVWGFVTESGERSGLGNYITEDFSVYITNYGKNFEVIDRNHLDAILKEHKLNSEGYIDEATAKQLGKIIAVDAIITGTYTVLNNSVKVRAKVLDTETALQFAANMGNLPMNENIASYLGISVKGGNAANKGFSKPLNSKETINNPKTVSADCKKKNIGDLCFYNALSEKVVIKFYYYPNMEYKYQNNYKFIILDSKETKCIYSLASRPSTYYVALWKDYVDEEKFRGSENFISYRDRVKYLKDKGEIRVETCKSKTFTIK